MVLIQGTPNNDFLPGSPEADEIFAGLGNDILMGFDGNDLLFGEQGNDGIEAGAGNDRVFGGGGDDNITAGAGADEVRGEGGNDLLFGNKGNDTIFGNKGNDLVSGNQGNDMVFGGMDDDDVRGGRGADTIRGDQGDDLVAGDLDDDEVFGNQGNDRVEGGGGNDTVRGGQGNDRVEGDAGDDEVHGDMGSDLVLGGEGLDSLYGGEGNDTFAIGIPFGGIDLSAADVIKDFNTAADTIALINNLPFSDIDLIAGTAELTGDTIIQHRPSGFFLAIVEGVAPGALTEDLFITISDTSPNIPPALIAPIDDRTSEEGDDFSLTIPPNTFRDPEGDVLTLSVAGLPPSLAFDPATLTISGVPTNADVGTIEVTVTADDGNGGTAEDVFTITVGDINSPPVVQTPLSDQTGIANDPLAFAIPEDAFVDPDVGDTLTLSVDGLPSWLSFDATARTFLGNPTTQDVGTANVTVTATDSGGLTASDVFAVTVNPDPRPITVSVVALDELATEPDTPPPPASPLVPIGAGDTATFRLSRTGDTSQPLTTSFNVLNIFGSAPPQDFFLSANGVVLSPDGTNTVTFGAFENTLDVVVTAQPDDGDAANEFVQIQLNAGNGFTLGEPSVATAVIVDNDPTVRIQESTLPDPVELIEGTPAMNFTVERTGFGDAIATPLTVNIGHNILNSIGGNRISFFIEPDATPDSFNDPIQVTIPAGATTATFTLTPIEDFNFVDDVVELRVEPSSTYRVDPNGNLNVTIIDNDVSIVESIQRTAPPLGQIIEGGGVANGQATFQVARNPLSPDAAVEVFFDTTGGTLGSDFILAPVAPTTTVTANSVIIPAGQDIATFTLEAIADTDTLNEDITLTLVPPADGSYTVRPPNVGDDSADVTIIDADVPTFSLTAASPTPIAEGGTATFTINRDSAGNADAVTLELTMAAGNTAEAEDFILSGSGVTGTTAVFAAGEFSKTVTVTSQVEAPSPALPAEDGLNETLALEIAANPALYNVDTGNNLATVFIEDTIAPRVQIVATDNTAVEGSSDLGNYQVQLTSGPFANDLVVSFSVDTGVPFAANPTDFLLSTGITNTVTIPAGQLSANIAIAALEDNPPDFINDQVQLNLSSSETYVINAGMGSATVMLQDNDSPPEVSIFAQDSMAVESTIDEGLFRISRTGPIDTTLDVNFAINTSVLNSATPGGDYVLVAAGGGTLTGNTLTIPFGQAFADLRVIPVLDGAAEPLENVQLDLLANPSVYDVALPPNDSALVTVDDGGIVNTVNILAPTGTATETPGNTATFTIQRSGSTAAPLTVNFTTAGTATFGSDYTLLDGVTPLGASVTIPAGAAMVDVTLAPMDDTILEPTETFILNLASGGYTIGPSNTQTTTIADNETEYAIALEASVPPTVDEPNAGSNTTMDIFTVTRSGDLSATTTVDVVFDTTGTNATDGGVDYGFNAVSGIATAPTLAGSTLSLTFLPGEATATINLTLVDDGIDTNDPENIVASLANPIAAGTGSIATGMGTAMVPLVDADANQSPTSSPIPAVQSAELPSFTASPLLTLTRFFSGGVIVESVGPSFTFNTTLAGQGEFMDPEGDSLNFSLTSVVPPTPGFTINAGTGVIGFPDGGTLSSVGNFAAVDVTVSAMATVGTPGPTSQTFTLVIANNVLADSTDPDGGNPLSPNPAGQNLVGGNVSLADTDFIAGGAGNDTLTGGVATLASGNFETADVLQGGTGNDAFVFGGFEGSGIFAANNAGELETAITNAIGHDIILDFTTTPGPDQDRILYLAGGPIEDTSDVLTTVLDSSTFISDFQTLGPNTGEIEELFAYEFGNSTYLIRDGNGNTDANARVTAELRGVTGLTTLTATSEAGGVAITFS